MKTLKFIILFLLGINIASSQVESHSTVFGNNVNSQKTNVNFDRWEVSLAGGISNGIRPYSEGYFSNTYNQLFNNLEFNTVTIGGRYNFSKILGLKMDFGYDKFKNRSDSRSKPFETSNIRTTIQGTFNLNSLINFERESDLNKDFSKFNLIFHMGIHLGRIMPTKIESDEILSNGENNGGIVFGITPTIRIYKKLSCYLDFSYYSILGQNLTWNGQHTSQNDNADGKMISTNLGFTYSFNKKK